MQDMLTDDLSLTSSCRFQNTNIKKNLYWMCFVFWGLIYELLLQYLIGKFCINNSNYGFSSLIIQAFSNIQIDILRENLPIDSLHFTYYASGNALKGFLFFLISSAPPLSITTLAQERILQGPNFEMLTKLRFVSLDKTNQLTLATCIAILQIKGHTNREHLMSLLPQLYVPFSAGIKALTLLLFYTFQILIIFDG